MAFLPHAIIIGILAALVQYTSMIPALADYVIAWAIFQTWALYFLAGAKPAPGAKSVLAGILGVLASIAIVHLGGQLVPALGPQPAFTLAVFVIATAVILMERIPLLSSIPAYFVAAGIFFALGNINPASTLTFRLLQVTLTLIFGFILGYLSVLLRTKYATLIAPPTPQPAAKQ